MDGQSPANKIHVFQVMEMVLQKHNVGDLFPCRTGVVSVFTGNQIILFDQIDC